MNIADMSRRAFVKTALAGAAGTLVSRTGKVAAKTTGTERTSLPTLTLERASQLLRNKKVSPVELTRTCLDRIEQLNPKLNAFITVTAESALAEARKAESEIQRGRWRGPLHGIPIALKDLVDTAGVRTTAASGVFKDRVPTEDAEIVRRLKAAGAVFLGKLNMHEFAFGGSSVIGQFGAVRNPWSSDYSTGGSSGGSAAAVAAGLCYGAIGSDTGGSIRQPSGYTSIVGMKPTYGRVSNRGIVPLAWSLDHVGPMTRGVKDAALMLQVMAGYDSEDPASLNTPVPDYTAGIAGRTSSLRLGIPRAFFFEAMDPEIQAAVEKALLVLKTLTGSQRDIPPLGGDPRYASVHSAFGNLLRAEAYAYHREFISKTADLYQAETLTRIRAGAEVDAPTYIQSRRQLEQIRRSISKTFEDVDLLITPTAVVTPFAIADLLGNMIELRNKEVLMLHNTRPFNLLGLPTISVPCGFTRTGLPIGMQVTGAAGNETAVFRLAHAYERATEWHTRHPAIAAS